MKRFKRPPRRRRDWEERLSAYLAACFDEPHRYGEQDCLLFVAGAIEAMTGRDYAEGQRRKYRSRTGAARHLRSLGYRSPEALIDDHLQQVGQSFARRGDIVLEDGVPGICVGGDAVFVGTDGGREGLVRRARSTWSKAWRV